MIILYTLVQPEEKARNYFYKVSLLETYKNGIATIESSSGDASTSLSLLREKESLQKKINDVKSLTLMGLNTF